jgi:hypothetical protein
VLQYSGARDAPKNVAIVIGSGGSNLPAYTVIGPLRRAGWYLYGS